MERWEHMVVRSSFFDTFVDKESKTDLIWGDGTKETVQYSDLTTGLEVMNRLGREGWRLVSVHVHQPEQSNALTKTYWLQRPLPPTAS